METNRTKNRTKNGNYAKAFWYKLSSRSLHAGRVGPVLEYDIAVQLLKAAMPQNKRSRIKERET